MDGHVASLLAMTIQKEFIALYTERLGVCSSSRDDKPGLKTCRNHMGAGMSGVSIVFINVRRLPTRVELNRATPVNRIDPAAALRSFPGFLVSGLSLLPRSCMIWRSALLPILVSWLRASSDLPSLILHYRHSC
jgi:hypothetical protein